MFSVVKMACKQRIRNIIWSHTLLVWALGVCPALPIVRCYPALPYTYYILIVSGTADPEVGNVGKTVILSLRFRKIFLQLSTKA